MKPWERVKKARTIGLIITTIAGSGNAPPPGQMPDYLRKQYGDYNQKVRSNEIRREISRLTTKTQTTTSSLDKKSAKRLRGK